VCVWFINVDRQLCFNCHKRFVPFDSEDKTVGGGDMEEFMVGGRIFPAYECVGE